MTQMDADKNTKDKENCVIIGIETTVHNEPEHGFLEVIYQDALEYELRLRGIPCLLQKAEAEDQSFSGFYLLS